jgi:hypothetical protein
VLLSVIAVAVVLAAWSLVAVLGSVLMHGIGAPAAARAFSRAQANRMAT